MGRRFDPDRAHLVCATWCFAKRERWCYFLWMWIRIFRSAEIAILILLIPLVAIFVTPWNNLDPISAPKLFISSIAIASLVFFRSISTRRIMITLDWWNTAFIFGVIAILASLLANNQFLSERIFGVNGRNVGALFIFCVLILQLASRSFSDEKVISKLILSIIVSSVIVSLYFVIQKFGLDQANWVDAYGGVPSSTLGNPNFVSSFVAIGLAASIPFMLANTLQLKLRFLLFLALVLQGYVVLGSKSFQGIMIVASSILIFALFLVLWKFNNILKKHLRNFQLLIVVLFFSSLIFLAIFGKKLVSSPTLQARLDYWEAGVAMISESPIVGQGFDYFGESYFIFRSESAAERSPGLFTDSAHNYFIDFGSFAGFPLLLAFLIPVFLTLSRFIRITIHGVVNQGRIQFEDLALTSCILAWLGFLFQAMISPISHALLVLGVILNGILFAKLGREKSERTIQINIRDSQKGIHTPRAWKIIEFGTFTSLITRMAGVFLAIVISLQGLKPFASDANFRDAIEQGNGDAILRIALEPPLNFNRMEFASGIFTQNNLPEFSIKIVRTLVRENPGNIRGWRLLYENSASTSTERLKARVMMTKLDPNNFELKKELGNSP